MSASRNPELVELVAHLTWGDGNWRAARDVVADLQALGHDGLNVQAVLACQRAAVEQKVVTIVCHAEFERREVLRLEPMLQERFRDCGIKRVCLVPGVPEMLDDLPRERLREIHAEVTLKLALRAARHANEMVARAARANPAGPYRVGVAWGRMMLAFARQLLATTPGLLPRNLKVYPIVGITDAEQALPVEANGIASIAARAWRGVSAQLQCPAIVRSDQYDLATTLEPVQKMLTVIRNELHVVFSGMGAIGGVQDASDITITPDPEFNAELHETARTHGASGEICYWCWDAEGRPIRDLPYRSIGLGLDALQRIAADVEGQGRRVVVITGGDKRRIAPLGALIRGRLASDIVTDTITARALLKEITY